MTISSTVGPAGSLTDDDLVGPAASSSSSGGGYFTVWYWCDPYFAPRYWNKPSGAPAAVTYVRRPMFRKAGSRGVDNL